MTNARRTIAIWSATVIAIGVIFVACGGTSSKSESATTTTTKSDEDLVMTDADFLNLRTMTSVDDHFIANPLGHLEQALKVASSPKGGTYPVGTIIQLVPQEAMVKRKAGFNPATNDWEFFFLDTSAAGTKIVTRGGEEVVNRFGGNCASCHAAAGAKFDLVCGKTHGCDPLPIGDDVIKAIQQADPRPS